MDHERAILRREREMSANLPSNSAGAPSAASAASYATSQYPSSAAGGGAPRSAMGKLFPSKPVPMAAGAPSGMRRPTVMDSDGYARRSEPSLSKAEIARLDSKTDSSDAYEFMRLRRSMPSASHGRAAEDLAWAHESIKQSEHRSTATSSSASTVSSGVGIASRSLTPPPDFAGGPVGGGSAGRPSAYQLQRAHTADVVQRTDGQALGDMSQLRQQVTLLRRSLEEEKKKRALEQKLMQDKIIELQGLIRHNMPEQKRELERNLNAMRTPAVAPTQPPPQQQQQPPSSSGATAGSTKSTPTQQQAGALPARVRALRNSKHLQQAQERSPYKTMKMLSELRPEQMELDDGTDEEVADADDVEDEVDLEETKERRGNQDEPAATSNATAATKASVRAVEAKMAQELTKLRARMRSVVLEAQNEVKALQQRLEEDHKQYERKERQLRMESSLRVTSLEERHNYAKKKLLAKTSLLSTQVAMLTDENHKLLQDVKCKDDRIRQLELALGGRRIVLESAKQHHNSNPQQQC